MLISTIPVQAMQLSDPLSAAVFIQKIRPLVTGCLNQARNTRNLEQLWQQPDCKALLRQNQDLQTAWGFILPGGSVKGIAAVPYEMRKPTVDAYVEYKKLAEKIASMSR